MPKTAKTPQVQEPEKVDDGKKDYVVTYAHRVGEPQRWYKHGDKVRLLDCEAQFSLSRGWLKLEGGSVSAPSAPSASSVTTASATTTAAATGDKE